MNKNYSFKLSIIILTLIAVSIFFIKAYFDTLLATPPLQTDTPEFSLQLVHVHIENGSIFNTPETSKDFHKHDTQLSIPPAVINKEDSAPNGAELFSSLGCSGCHGQEGKSVNPMFPKLAGLKEDYIISELKKFQTKQRVSPLMYPNAVKAIGFEEDLARYLSAIK